MDWQPIETAAKNGTPVLLFDPEYRTHVGSYLPVLIEVEPGDGRVFHQGRWICWSDRLNDNFSPTHWMPLPEPPQ